MPSSTDVTINQGSVFSFYFKVVGVMMILFAVVAPFRLEYGLGLAIVSVALLFFGLAFLTATRTLRVNARERHYQEQIAILGMRFGPRREFEGMALIFMNSVRSETGDIDYKGFLLFSNQSRILLDSDADKLGLLKRLEVYGELLGVEVRDSS